MATFAGREALPRRRPSSPHGSRRQIAPIGPHSLDVGSMAPRVQHFLRRALSDARVAGSVAPPPRLERQPPPYLEPDVAAPGEILVQLLPHACDVDPLVQRSVRPQPASRLARVAVAQPGVDGR